MPIPLQTLFYRCPEVVFGAPALTVAVDMWNVGVMLSELAGDPFTVCQTSRELVHLWCSRLGSPEIPQHWPLCAELLPAGSDNVAVQPMSAKLGLSVHGVELLRGLVVYNPSVRLSVARVSKFSRLMTSCGCKVSLTGPRFRSLSCLGSQRSVVYSVVLGIRGACVLETLGLICFNGFSLMTCSTLALLRMLISTRLRLATCPGILK